MSSCAPARIFALTLVLSSCALVRGEPEQESAIFINLFPSHMQSYAVSPPYVSVALQGDLNDTLPVREVLKDIQLIDLTHGERIALEPTESDQDETYRGAETQRFAIPQLSDGEYEMYVELGDWGKKLAPGSAIEEEGTWRSRFRIDGQAFYLNAVSSCDTNRLFLQFSEPFAAFRADELATRVLVLVEGEKAIACKAANLDGELVGGALLELECEVPILAPFRVVFSEFYGAEEKKYLSSRGAPGALLNEVLIESRLEIDVPECAGWVVP